MLYGFLVLSFFAVRRTKQRFYVRGNKKGGIIPALKENQVVSSPAESPLLTPR